MQKPLVHLNGSSKSDLSDGYHRAMRATHDALEALQAASPNARDYYPQGPDAYSIARREHDARCEALRGVIRDMTELYEHVDP